MQALIREVSIANSQALGTKVDPHCSDNQLRVPFAPLAR